MKGFQFSLRVLLAAITAVGICAALWVAEPSWQVGAAEALLLAWVPASTIILISTSTGKAKAWWIGIAAECAVAALIYIVIFFSLYTGMSGQAVFLLGKPVESLQYVALRLSICLRPLLLAWAFAPVVGLLCVLTHWLFVHPPQPKE